MGLSSNHVSGNTVHVMASQQHHQMRESEVPLRCPRCKSANTKFCYYNNYSKSQPRHYCRACRRHWTDGGVLRDVPVGGLRKSKRRLRRASKASPIADTTADTATSASADLDAATVHTPRRHRPTQFPPLDCDVAWFSHPPASAMAVNDAEYSAYDDITNPFSFSSVVSSSSASGVSPCDLIGGLDEESLAGFDCWGEITDLVTLELNSSPIHGRIVDGLWIE